MRRNLRKQLLNLGLKLGLMLKDHLIAKAHQMWQEMQFTEEDKKQLKFLLSRKGKQKREEILQEIKEKGAQKLGLTESNREDFQNFREKLRELGKEIKDLEEE